VSIENLLCSGDRTPYGKRGSLGLLVIPSLGGGKTIGVKFDDEEPRSG
jgi:hypothetical protein